MSQRPNRIGIPKEGPKLCFEFQKKSGLRLREEGVKKVLLWDTTGCSPSPYQGCVVGQSPSPPPGDFVGRSPSPYCNMDEAERPIEKTFLVDQSVKSLGSLVEIAKGVVSLSLVSLQGCGDLVEEERGFQENLPTKTLGKSEDNNIARGLSKEERRFFTEAKGSQIED